MSGSPPDVVPFFRGIYQPSLTGGGPIIDLDFCLTLEVEKDGENAGEIETLVSGIIAYLRISRLTPIGIIADRANSLSGEFLEGYRPPRERPFHWENKFRMGRARITDNLVGRFCRGKSEDEVIDRLE